MTPLRVYIGFDAREDRAYHVAEKSLLRRSTAPVCVTPLDIRRFEANGLLRRPTDLRGQRYDLPSNAPASTEFAISRFLVPLLAHQGWALFVDGDVVFLDNVADLFAHADPQYAVMCVKHGAIPGGGMKMDGQIQTQYPRKNWSSVILWNCDHPANRRLSLTDIQERRGFDLHGLYWLNDAEIGALPAEWNWLVNVEPKPLRPKLAHFTQGGPFIPGWTAAEHDSIWYEEERHGIENPQTWRKTA